MCAFVKDKRPYTAIDDISVIKVLIIKDGKLITPKQEVVIPEIPYTMVAEGKSDLTCRDDFGYYHIEGGYVHSLEVIIKIRVENSSHNMVLVKSHIPAGSKYYRDEGLLPGICSDKLVLDEIIPYDVAKIYCDAAPDSLIEEVLKHKEEFKEELEEVCV